MPPPPIEVTDADLEPLKDSVVLLTGGASGIGLATVKLLLSVGAYVVVGDLAPPQIEHERFSFQKTNVLSWEDLKALFKFANSKHGVINHVFANAGISEVGAPYFMEAFDEAGELKEPNHIVLEINLKGILNTSALALHYLRRQEKGGSIVVTASGSSFQRFVATEYVTAKHGVLGFMRGLVPTLPAFGPPIRVNALSPSWTVTGLVPQGPLDAIGLASQTPEPVARAAAILMADNKRQGELLYIAEYKIVEIENNVLLKAVPEILGDEWVLTDIADKMGFLKHMRPDVSKGPQV